MNFDLPQKARPLLQVVEWIGQRYLRPVGLEADANGAPPPPDHPFFQIALERGFSGGFIGKVETGKKKREDDGRPRTRARRAVVLAEEAAYWDRGMATMLPGPGLGGAPVMLMGNEAQKARFLDPFKQRDRPRWAAFAMTEPGAGSDVARIRTRARRDGDHWVLNGEKCFISNGARAEFAVVWATVDPEAGRAGHRAFVVEKGTAGFCVARIEHKMGLVASETASLLLEDCRIPGDHLLGGSDQGREGFKGAMKTFNLTRPLVAAMAVGIARAAHDEATRFAGEAFTGPSAWRLERVRDRLAEIRRRIEVARLLAWKAAWLADHRKDNAEAAAMSKATAATVGLRAASLGLEVLGEAGGASDTLIEKLFRDVKALDIVEGTGQIQRVVIARRRVGGRKNG